jgi:hypothetical protein
VTDTQHRRRFYILGCQRTGTTLVRLILESHSKIFCFDERTAYDVLAGSSYQVPPEKELLGFKLPRWTEQFKDPYLTDFPTLMNPVPRFYAGEPIIFLLRDVLDTAASMLTLRLPGQQIWIEQWGVPSLKYRYARSETFRTRYQGDMQRVRASRHPNAAYAALYWKYKTAAFFEYLEEGWPVLGVRYEDLVTRAGPQIKRMVESLQVPWEQALLDHAAAEHGELFETGLTVGLTDPKRAIDTASLGTGQRLSVEDVDQIMAIAGELNERVAGLKLESGCTGQVPGAPTAGTSA